MNVERGNGSLDALQAAINKHLETEGPKLDLFHGKLDELRMPLAERQLDDNGFFKRLIDETEPVRTITNIFEETMNLERTPEGQIRISPQYTRERQYAVEALIDFDENGKLRIKGIVHYRGRPTKRTTLPTIDGEVSANSEARYMVNDFLLDLMCDKINDPLADSLTGLPVEESFPVD